MTDSPSTASSLLEPFRHRAFSVIWGATLISNIGSWMYSSSSAWLMTSLDADPSTVSLVQVAASLPMFLLAIPAGAIADMVDRRHYLIISETFITLVSAAFAVIVSRHWANVWNLLMFTFLVEAGSAFTNPVWQSIVPSLVPAKALPPAIAVNSIGVNISRAIGPALGGAAMASIGIAVPFWTNVVTNLASIGALIWWKEPPSGRNNLPRESYGEALRVGVRHALYNKTLKSTLISACSFFFLASSYWALLPLIAARSGKSTFYGTLLGLIGIGAIVGAVVLRPLGSRIGVNRLVVLGFIGSGVACLIYGHATSSAILLLGSLIAGAGWITVLTNLNIAAQLTLPDWVRGRGLAIYVTFVFGALTAGSYVWGRVGHGLGLSTALSVAGILLAIAGLRQLRRPLEMTSKDLEPSLDWPIPWISPSVISSGPVMVSVEYHVHVDTRVEFLQAIAEFAQERSRDGGYGWRLYEDSAIPGRFVESFRLDSWNEHLLQHARVTRTDRAREDALGVCLQTPPVVTHWMSAQRTSTRAVW